MPDVSNDILDEAPSSSTADLQARQHAAAHSTTLWLGICPKTAEGSREASSVKGLFVKYRESFLRCLSGDSTQIGTAAVRVLVNTVSERGDDSGSCVQVSLVLHPNMDPDVLDICGVLPVRTRIRRNLLNELTGSGS